MGLQNFLAISASGIVKTSRLYHNREWAKRTEFTVGINNVKWERLIYPCKILMPPLHITLGLIKQFVKVLNKEFAKIKHLREYFKKLSEANVMAGVFVWPNIKKTLNCEKIFKKNSPRQKVKLRTTSLERLLVL